MSVAGGSPRFHIDVHLVTEAAEGRALRKFEKTDKDDKKNKDTKRKEDLDSLEVSLSAPLRLVKEVDPEDLDQIVKISYSSHTKASTGTKFYNLLELFQGQFPFDVILSGQREGDPGDSFMGGFLKCNRGPIFFLICSFCFVLLFGRPIFVLAQVEENPLKQRVQKLKGLRERKDRFFREDSQSPLKEADRKKFKGLPYYPIDLRYAMVAPIEKYPVEQKPIYATLPTNKPMGKKYVKYGRFKFRLEGKEYAFQIYRPLAGDDLFLPFKDKTSGKETYEKGRYLYIEPMPGGKVLVDFNRAYNPFCQYNDKYTCPFAPQENWLDVAIPAGEKRFE